MSGSSRDHPGPAAREIPSPEEWAREQLKNAPVRSEAWARRVARIYCLEIGEPEDRINKKENLKRGTDPQA